MTCTCTTARGTASWDAQAGCWRCRSCGLPDGQVPAQATPAKAVAHSRLRMLVRARAILGGRR